MYIKRVGAEFDDILKVFTEEDMKGYRYLWKETISGQQTGSIIFLDHISQITSRIFRIPDAYDNEMSYSFKMNESNEAFYLAKKRGEDMVKRHAAMKAAASPGNNQVSKSGSEEPLEEKVHVALNAAIKEVIEAGEFEKIENAETGGFFMVLEDDAYEAAVIKAAKNAGIDASLLRDVECHPGTNRTRLEADPGKIEKYYYIRKSDFNRLTDDGKTAYAKHEAKHIENPGLTEAEVNACEGCDVRQYADANRVMENAGAAINSLVESLIRVSAEAKDRDQQVLLALDLDLGDTDAAKKMIADLIKGMPTLNENNEELKKLLENLTIICEPTEKLAGRVRDISTLGQGKFKPENIIIITKNSTLETQKEAFKELEDAAVIAGVEDRKFPDGYYVPVVEIMFLAVGRYLGWSDEKIREQSQDIPNVEDIELSTDKKSIIIRLIPRARKFDSKELQNIMQNITKMLASA